MKKKELQEILALLDEAGMQYELCNTPVPVSLKKVPCGSPTKSTTWPAPTTPSSASKT